MMNGVHTSGLGDSDENKNYTNKAPSNGRCVNYRHEQVGELGVYVLLDQTSTNDVIRDIIRQEDVDEIEKPIFCTNLDDVIDRYQLWQRELPDVKIFYAIKTYDSPVMVQLLNNLGACFEIASKTEAEHCINLGIKPENIICNHPYKQGPHLQYFAMNNVRVMSVDSPDELDKIARIYPDADLMIRIVPAQDIFDDGFHFDVKFGATEAQAEDLLRRGKDKGLNFIGVAFHVGSATKDDTVHERSLEMARRIFDYAKTLDYDFNLLDIGGGFPGGTDTAEDFTKICRRLRPALKRHFPAEMNVKIIAEPGRYFATSAVTTYASVVGRRRVAKCQLLKAVQQTDDTHSDPDDQNSFVYILNDGVWGSMNYILAENDYQPLRILNPKKSSEIIPCIMWGPTCDSLDRLTSVHNQNELNIGEWVYRINAGSYAHTLRTNFNGMPRARYVFTIRQENIHYINREKGIKMPYL